METFRGFSSIPLLPSRLSFLSLLGGALLEGEGGDVRTHENGRGAPTGILPQKRSRKCFPAAPTAAKKTLFSHHLVET